MIRNPNKKVGMIIALAVSLTMVVSSLGMMVGGQAEEKVNALVAFDLESDSNFIRRAMESYGAEIDRFQDKGAGRVWLKISPEKLERLKEINGVETAEIDEGPIDFLDLISTSTYMGHDVAQTGGFTGSGILGEVQDGGCQVTHPDFSVDYTDGVIAAADHGTCTFGIVFSQGTNNMATEGMIPDAVSVFADYNDNSKYVSVSHVWNGQFTSGNAGQNGLFQSNSWGYSPMDGTYGTHTQEADQASYDFPRTTVLWAAGNSNSGVFKGSISQESTCKNALSVGAIWHENTANMADDSWYSGGTGNTPSQGPTADGRQKPDVIGPFDDIYCADRTGTSGYSTTDYYTGFGGTSGATPIVAGIVGQAYEMYIENYFDNNPGGAIPYSTTIKSLIIADAYQYDLADSDRDSQGWGSADAEQIYTLGADYHVFEDGKSVSEGGTWSRQIFSDGTMPLKISMSWLDPPAAATTGSARALKNNLDLKITSPTGTVYWGNNGLYTNHYSSSGTGVNTWSISSSYRDDLNNVENVFIQYPETGAYTVEVFGRSGDMQSSPQMFSMVAAGAQDVSSAGTIDLDKSLYKLEDTATITVSDVDLNTNPSTAQTVVVNVNSNAEPAGESVTLTETGPDTSTFEGSLTLSATNSAGVLMVAHGNTVTATYNDADDGSGSPAVVTDTATVDGQVLQASGLTVEWFGSTDMTWVDEDFTSGVPPTGWTVSNTGTTGTWSQSYTTSAGGTSPEARFMYGSSGTGTSRLRCGPFDTSGLTSLDLQFRQFYDAYGTGVTVKVQTSTDGSTWTDTGWALIDRTTNLGPSVINEAISTAEGAGSASLYIAFVVDRNSYQLDYWYIDDVLLTSTGGSVTSDNWLNWTLSGDDGAGANDVDHYNIYRANNGAGPWDAGALVTTVPAGMDTWTDYGRGEPDGINWYYVVRAEDLAGNEDPNTNAVPEQSSGNSAPNPPFNPSPPDMSVGISTAPTLSVTVTDPDGDTMDVFFYDNTATQIGWDNNVPSGSTASINWNGLSESTTYYWYAVADDGEFSTPSLPPGTYWEFTTLDTIAPVPATGLTVEHWGPPSGTWDTLFSEGFSTGIADGDWQGDDLGSGTDVTCSEEWWEVVETGGDLTDIKVGNYNTPPSTQSLQFIDCDDDWAGQYAIAHYNGGNNWFDLTGYTDAYINLSMFGAGFGTAIEGWRLEITTNGGGAWTTAIEEVAAAAIHNWQNYNYQVPYPASFTNQFGFRINVAGSASTDIGTFDDITLEAYGTIGAANYGDNSVNWTASSDDGAGADDVDYYNIYRSDIETGPWDLAHIIDTVPATGAAGYSYLDIGKGQADAIIWWYVVRAVDTSSNQEMNTVAVPEPTVLDQPFDIDLTGFSAGDWVFVSYPIDISGNLEEVLDDSILGDGATTWDIALWWNPLDPADPWKTYRFGGTSNDMPSFNNRMGVWLHLTANAGDQMLTTALAGQYPSLAVNINLYAGWNLVSYPSASASLASATLPLQADMVAVYQAAAPYVLDFTNLNLVTFTEGNAYWVHVTADCIWPVDP